MGRAKSPGRWIKTLLFGEKTSKHDVKGTEKFTNDAEVLVGARAPEANYHAASQPNAEIGIAENKNQRENEEIQLQDRGIETDENLDMAQTQDAPQNPDIIRQEMAATKTQAAFRGYLVIAKGMTTERDQFLKYVDSSSKNRKWRCTLCNGEFAGRTSRILPHLAGIPRQNIRPCGVVNQEVREEAIRVFIICTGGTSGTGTEGTVSGTSQSVAPIEGASNPNDVQNSNRPGCALQQTSFDPPTGTGTTPACPWDQGSLPPGDRPLDNLDNTQQRDLLNPRLYAAHGNEIASSFQQFVMHSLASASLDIGEQLQDFTGGDVLPIPLLSDITTTSNPPNSNEQYPGFGERFADEVILDSPVDSTENLQRSLRENPPELPDAIANASEEIGLQEFTGGEITQDTLLYPTENFDKEEIFLKSCEEGANASEELEMDELHNPTPMDIDPSTASQQLEASTNTVGPSSAHASAPPQLQIVPHGCINLTTMHQNPTLASSSSKKQSVTCHPQALMDKDSCMPSSSQAPNNAPPPPQILPCGTGLIGPSSIPDMNEGAPITSHPNTRNNFEEHGALKRKLGEVNKLLEHVMVGEEFQKNTTKILEYLLGSQISQLGICGMGGIGKTTIMLHIHNRLLEEANYGDVLWITVSWNFKTRKLQDTIWEALGLGKLREKDLRKRAAMLCDHLMERGKLTIILDDVWKCIDLTRVGIPVKVDGIKLVLTTRFFDICHQMQCHMIKIEPLSDIEAESLFLEKLQFEVALNLESKAVVMSVIKECAGLPLAIVTIARSMRGVTDMFEWKDCLEKLRESDRGQTDMEKVLKKLKFSYNRLGDHEYQQCFLSCALYPEDWLIDKFELIEFFIDQGLISQLNTREKQYDRGFTILQKLVNACLLEDHGSKMKMHDLIRDMALHVMSVTSIVKAGKGLQRIPSEKYWTDALEKVSLMENDIEEFPSNMSPNCPKLSTFLLNNSSSYDFVIPDSFFFKHLWGLKVLNLSGCKLKELPDSISDLVNLTALLLERCDKLRRVPYLGKLKSLTKLDIAYCQGVEALEGLDMLVTLRYLDIIATGIKRLPKGTLGALLNLQWLRAMLVNEEITKLWALETLVCFFNDVDDYNKFVRVISKRMNSPFSYKIRLRREGFGYFPHDSTRLPLEYCEKNICIDLRSHAFVSRRGERSAFVSMRGERSGSGSGICILIPHDVEYLSTCNCDGATNLSDTSPLEKLEDLVIKCWSNLRVLCGGQDEEVIDIHNSPTRTPTPLLFRSLMDLTIFQCPKLKYLFGHEPKFSLPHLQMIRIMCCVEMVGITAAATSPPPYPSPALPSLEVIGVWECPKIKRVVEFEWLPHFPNLGVLHVYGDLNMSSRTSSVKEISPERLPVEECQELPLNLRNVQTIQVIGCGGMAEMISGAGQGQEGSTMTPVNNTPSSSQSSISLPKLKSLVLDDLPQLKSICEVPITCNSMGYLKVIGCPKLNRIPLELQLRDIEDLPYIAVEGEEKWKTLIWDHLDAQAKSRVVTVF